MGISAVVVRDTVYVEGELAEDTYDWFAQDRDGNVWYLGEVTQEFENGERSTPGSWEAGVDGALPGIVMLAEPHGRRRLPPGVLPRRGRGHGRGHRGRATLTIGPASTPTSSSPRTGHRWSPT